MTFADFQFSPELQKAIGELGYTTPTPIQLETLPILLGEGTDFLGLAATGTGKTAAFAIPLLETISPEDDGVQALILCPTRELAKQTSEQINLLARYKKTKALAIYGGSDYGGQLRALRDGVSIVVGTPGRIIDHLERGTLKLSSLQTVVLDEADEMISMGFKEEIETILKTVTQEQELKTWLFSATMSPEIRRIADQFLNNPKQIQINRTEMVTTSVKQHYYAIQEHEKMNLITKIIDSTPEFYGLIFCQTKALVVELTQFLRDNGYLSDCLHGDMEQNARERTLKSFKARVVNVLICTDVASRGIDVKDVSHVINYSLPRELDLYVHRIGRTGRGGKEGIALSLVTPSHFGLLSRLERTTKVKLNKLPVPKESDLVQIKIKRAVQDFEGEASGDSFPVSDMIQVLKSSEEWNKAIAEMDKEEVVARFLIRALKLRADRNPVKAKTGVVGNGGFMPSEGSESQKRENIPGETRDDRRRGFRDRQDGGGRSFDRAPRSYGDRPSYGAKRSFGDRPAYGEKKAFGDRPAYGEKKSFGDRPAYGEKKAFGDRPAYGAKKAFGDRPAYGAKKAFGDRPAYGTKKAFGDSAAYGENAPSPAAKKPYEKTTKRFSDQADKKAKNKFGASEAAPLTQ